MVATSTACTSEGRAQPARARRTPSRVRHRCLSTDRVLVGVADGSEVGLGAPPSTGIAKPAGVLGGRGVAVPGHVACADHGRQGIIVCRIRPCVAEMSLAKSWDGVLAADRGKKSRRSTRFPSTKPVVPTGTCVASLATAITFQSRPPSSQRAMPRESVNNETSNARKMSKLGRDCSRYQDRYGICWKLSGTAGRTVTTTVTCPSVGTGGQGESVAHHRS